MKKTPIKQLPDAFINWADNIEDFWLGKFIHSLGYSKKEIYRLTKKNKKLDYAIKYAVESLFEKSLYKIFTGEIKLATAGYLMTYWGQVFKIIRPSDYSKFTVLSSGKNYFGEFLENDSDSDKPPKKNNNSEFKPFIRIVKKRIKE